MSKLKLGFTLIEMVLVIALVAIIAAATVTFGLPVIGQFSCVRETETALDSLTRARYLAQYSGKGNVEVKISDDQYIMESQHDFSLLDHFSHDLSVSVFMPEIVFEGGSGARINPESEITIGSATSSCKKIITINDVGAIM